MLLKWCSEKGIMVAKDAWDTCMYNNSKLWLLQHDNNYVIDLFFLAIPIIPITRSSFFLQPLLSLVLSSFFPLSHHEAAPSSSQPIA